MCVQLHGDASFTGQGIVMEGLGLSEPSFLKLLYSLESIYIQAIYLTSPVAGASIW